MRYLYITRAIATGLSATNASGGPLRSAGTGLLLGLLAFSVAHAAVLCPSFYHAELVENPAAVERFMQGRRRAVIGFLQKRTRRKRAMAW